jgi:ABC-type branched-subunit amino acid transport system substrate-binding protein
MQIKTLVDYAVHIQGDRRFAVLYPNESYGEIFMNLFWDAVVAAGGRVVGVEAYDPGKTDFADPIQKLVGRHYDIPEDLVEEPIQTPQALNPETPDAPDVSDISSAHDPGRWNEELMAAGPKAGEAGPATGPIVDFDAIFIPDSPDKAGLILPQLAYYDVNDVHLLGTNLWHSDKLIDMARSHSQGAVVPEGFFEKSRKEHVRRFVAEFESVYGHAPGFIQAVAYDTAWILFDLAGDPNLRFRAQIKNALLTMPPFSGVTGTTTFDPSGEAVKDIYLLQVRGRQFEEIQMP